MATIVNLSQAAWTVPSPPLMTSIFGRTQSNRAERVADLFAALDLVMENVGMVGA